MLSDARKSLREGPGRCYAPVPMSSCCSAPPPSESSCCATRSNPSWLQLGLATFIAAQSMAFGLAVNISPPDPQSRLLIHTFLAAAAVLVYLLVGIGLTKQALSAAFQGKIVMEQLFLVGILGAFGASLLATLRGEGAIYYEIVAVLLAIYTFGRIIARHNQKKAWETVHSLAQQYSFAQRLSCCGTEETVAIDQLRPGDTVIIRPGQDITVDGVVIEGQSFVRESVLNGEVFPVTKSANDYVAAGSLALDGTLHVQVTELAGERKLDQLLHALEKAAQTPSRIERHADRVVAWLLPMVMLAAVATFVAWSFLVAWPIGLLNALAVLLIACPCAMGLATPIGLWNALNRLGQEGLVLRSGDEIDALAQVDTVIFDKTGTLSEEDFRVSEVIYAPAWADGEAQRQVRTLVASLQAESLHPLAHAFRAWAAGVKAEPITSQLEPGRGLSALFHGQQLSMSNQIPVAQEEVARLLESRIHYRHSGLHKIYLTLDDELVALFVLREQWRASSALALRELDRLGLDVRIMTGDPQWSGVEQTWVPSDRVSSGMTPAAKAEAIQTLQSQGRRVLFLGDGSNDAPALQEADLGLALRSGTALSRESAGGELFGGDLTRIPWAIQQTRSAIKTIRGNMLFAFCYNTIGIGLAAFGVLNPVVAALIMLVSSATVTWRALRGVEGRKPDSLGDGQSDGSDGQADSPGHAGPSKEPAWQTRVAVVLWFGHFIFLLSLAGLSWGLTVLLAATVTLSMGRLGWLFNWQTLAAGVGMLFGWFMDAGWGAVVREGVCLCPCVDSSLGWGLVWHWGWMENCMLISMGVALWFHNRGHAGLVSRILLPLISMLIAMKLAALTLAFALSPQVDVIHPGLFFVTSYAAMLLIMMAVHKIVCSHNHMVFSSFRSISRA